MKITYTKHLSIILDLNHYINENLDPTLIMSEMRQIDGIWMIEKQRLDYNIKLHIKEDNLTNIEEIVNNVEALCDRLLHEKNILLIDNENVDDVDVIN
jgi:hypothetical protein